MVVKREKRMIHLDAKNVDNPSRIHECRNFLKNEKILCKEINFKKINHNKQDNEIRKII